MAAAACTGHRGPNETTPMADRLARCPSSEPCSPQRQRPRTSLVQQSWTQGRPDGLGSTEESNVDETAAVTDRGIRITRSNSAPSLLRIEIDDRLFCRPILSSAISPAASVGTSGSPCGSLPPPPEDVSKLDLALMACTIALLVPVALNVQNLASSWETRWKVLYIIFMVVSLVSTIAGFLAAACFRAKPEGIKFSYFCARLGLIVAAALLVVFMVCKLGRFGCAAGVAGAAGVVVLLAVVWILSELIISQGQQAAKNGASVCQP